MQYKVTRFDGEVFDSFEDATFAVRTRIPGWEIEHGIYIMDADAEYATKDSFVYDTAEASWVTLAQWYKNDDMRHSADMKAALVRTAIAVRWVDDEAPYSVARRIYELGDWWIDGDMWDGDGVEQVDIETMLWNELFERGNSTISTDDIIRKVILISERIV